MRRLRVGLYRISIFLDRFQRLHFSPNVRRDVGIHSNEESNDDEPDDPVADEPPAYAKWLMALSADDLLELEDTRLLVAEVLRSLYHPNYRTKRPTWANGLPYSVLQSSLNTMNPLSIAYLLKDPSNIELKNDKLNPLTEENQAFLDGAIWCALRLRGRGIRAGRVI